MAKQNFTKLGIVVFTTIISFITAKAQSSNELQLIHAKVNVDSSCPCQLKINGEEWENHQAYLKCVTKTLATLILSKEISPIQAAKIEKGAFTSDCGQAIEDDSTESAAEGSPGVLTLVSIDPNAFNCTTTSLIFTLDSATFFNDPSRQHLYVDNKEVPIINASIEQHRITIPYTWTDGFHEITFLATDTSELTISDDYNFWTGTHQLPITVVDTLNKPVPNAIVKVILTDNTNVMDSGITNEYGIVTFSYIPPRTLVLTAQTSSLFGTSGTVGLGNPITIKTKGFNTPSNIDNNDFSLGLAGWNIGNAPVTLVPHQEQFKLAATQQDLDLQLSTLGEGEQSISRTYTIQTTETTKTLVVPENSVGVTVRYQFTTSEVPGGYYGSQYNDYYAVSLKNENSGEVLSETKAMNSFALSEFDQNGSLSFRELSISGQPGDIVQLDTKVANVGDGAYDSKVTVDKITDSKFRIVNGSLKDIDNTALQQISLDNHSYFNGYTRLNGSFQIQGSKNSKLAKVVLEILKNGQVIATGQLNPSLQNQVLTTFGSDEKISVTNASPLFLIPAQDLGLSSENVELRLAAELEAGDRKTYSYKPSSLPVFNKMDLAASARFGTRDTEVGGDDWGEPSIVSLIESSLSSKMYSNDLSNMNGGNFSPHKEHKYGKELDARYTVEPPSFIHTAEYGTNLLSLLNGPDSSRIKFLRIAFTKTDDDAFWQTVKDDPSVSKIIKDPSHYNHFHLNLIATSKNLKKLKAPAFKMMSRRTLAIQNFSKKPLVTNAYIYPNPAINSVNVALKNLKDTSAIILKNIVRISLIDRFGKLQKEYRFSENAQNINIQLLSLPEDYYMFRIFDSKNQSVSLPFSKVH